MLDQFIYEDHLGRRFDGLSNKVYLNYNDLRDYLWSYETINNRISNFYRPIRDRKIPLLIHCESEAEAINVKNRLFDFTETDVEAMIPGKIYIGDYYTRGYVISSAKSSYLINERICKIDLTLTSDDPSWYKETLRSFNADNSGSIDLGSGADYPYDYAYDYDLSTNGSKIMCDSIGSSMFKLLIYGPAVNPTVVINGHKYAINGTIGEKESALIDSVAKTITLTTASGQKVNWFDKRNREDYIFEPIQAGQNLVSWPGTFGFDLTIIEKRSEPRWT